MFAKSCLRLPSLKGPVPDLSNFAAAKQAFKNLVLQGNKELNSVWLNEQHAIDSFRRLFPEIVEQRGITRLPGDNFNSWESKASNDISVEIDTISAADSHFDFLAVGGPSALTASVLFKLKQKARHVMHAVTSRLDSNHDGSAYYYHQRDAVPVYVNKVNRGPYCIFIDLKKRIMGPRWIADQCEHNRNHVKISLNWSNFRLRHAFTIFIPNFYHMVMDIYLRDPKKSQMRHAVEHACLTDKVVQYLSSPAAGLNAPKEDFTIHGTDRACYVGFEGGTDPREHFTWLNKYVFLPFQVVDHRHFGPLVKQVLSFPRDGLINPFVFTTMANQLQALGGQSRTGLQVKKLLVRPVDGDPSRIQVTKVVYVDNGASSSSSSEALNPSSSIDQTQPSAKTEHVATVNDIVLSLGPSASFTAKPLSFKQAVEVSGGAALPLSRKAALLFRNVLNTFKGTLFRGRDLLKDFMWAAGSSSVVLICADTAKVSAEKLDIMSKFLDGVNQHWTPIAVRDLETADGRVFHCVALQMTGGGNFPSRLVRPDYLLNLLHTTEHVYGLGELAASGAITYDIVQARGCGRGVSGKNTIAFLPLARNCVVNYALGGIGMSTMFPNGLLLTELLGDVFSGKLRQGEVTDGQSITQRFGCNIFSGIDYTTMVDDAQTAARAMGLDPSLSKSELFWLSASLLSISSALGLGLGL